MADKPSPIGPNLTAVLNELGRVTGLAEGHDYWSLAAELQEIIDRYSKGGA